MQLVTTQVLGNQCVCMSSLCGFQTGLC